MMEASNSALIFDWNRDEEEFARKPRVEFFDETLRDGLQSPSVRTPDIESQIRILHLMSRLGIQTANIGFLAAGPHVYRGVMALGREIRDQKLSIRPASVGRTVVADMEPIVRASDELGIPIEAACFIGSSEIRRVIEDWDLDEMLRNTEKAVRYLVEHGMTVMYVTEDTTRARPETLERLYKTAIECGARRICACDTVGHSTPNGVRHLITFLRKLVQKTGEDVKIDWHGHNDRGLGLINTIAALQAGADRLEAAALGIGERCGNTSMDQLLLNLKLMGVIDNDLTSLDEYCHVVSEAVGVPIPVNYPAFGADAFRTAAGVHAAAIIKALEDGNDWLANRVYSGVPAEELGRKQSIGIGPVSGRSNIIYWLKTHGVPVTEERIERIFQAAKESKTLLTDAQLERLCQQ